MLLVCGRKPLFLEGAEGFHICYMQAIRQNDSLNYIYMIYFIFLHVSGDVRYCWWCMNVIGVRTEYFVNY
jgi:hypothetical protein